MTTATVLSLKLIWVSSVMIDLASLSFVIIFMILDSYVFTFSTVKPRSEQQSERTSAVRATTACGIGTAGSWYANYMWNVQRIKSCGGLLITHFCFLIWQS